MRTRSLESPVCTQDGVLHRVPREIMREPVWIRARMALDMRAVMAERGVDCVLDAELVALGWTNEQIAAHGEGAARIIREADDEGATCKDGLQVAAPPPAFAAPERIGFAACLALAMAMVAAGFWSIASGVSAAQALGQRILLSVTL